MNKKKEGWVRFWAQGRHAAAPGTISDKWEFSYWHSENELKEYAQEIGERDYGYLERGFNYGFEIREPDEDEKKILRAHYRTKIEYAVQMLRRLF